MVLEPQKGKDRILMFRKKGDKTAAAKLALQTEHKWEYERKTDSTKTKDGAISAAGGLEVTLSIEAVASRDELNNMLKNYVIEGYELDGISTSKAKNKVRNIQHCMLSVN